MSLDRAISREADPGWLAWLIATLVDAAGSPVVDRPSLEQFLCSRRDLTKRLLSAPGNPWTLKVVHDAVSRPPADVLTDVLAVVEEALPKGRATPSSGGQAPMPSIGGWPAREG